MEFFGPVLRRCAPNCIRKQHNCQILHLTPFGAGDITARRETPASPGTGEAGHRVGVAITAMLESREVMNIRQASVYLGVSRDTLYRYIYEDRIPAFKLGNRWKFKKTVLDRWIDKQISLVNRNKKR